MTRLLRWRTTFAALPRSAHLRFGLFRNFTLAHGSANRFQGCTDFSALLRGPNAPFSIWVFSSSAVFAAMLGCTKNLKIFQTIVRSILVFMVHMLSGHQTAAKVVLHHKPVLVDVTRICCSRMFWHPDAYIAVWVDESTSTWSFAWPSCDFTMFLSSGVDPNWHWFSRMGKGEV